MIGGVLVMKKSNEVKKSNFSKDNHIAEVSSKQSQVQTQAVVAPVKPKEIKRN